MTSTSAQGTPRSISAVDPQGRTWALHEEAAGERGGEKRGDAGADGGGDPTAPLRNTAGRGDTGRAPARRGGDDGGAK